MFVSNPSVLISKYETRSKILANYIIRNGTPLLSEKDGVFYFGMTDELQSILDKSPLWLKLFI